MSYKCYANKMEVMTLGKRMEMKIAQAKNANYDFRFSLKKNGTDTGVKPMRALLCLIYMCIYIIYIYIHIHNEGADSSCCSEIHFNYEMKLASNWN